jgi:hypothetical protein
MPLAIVIEGANRHDMKLTKPTLESLKVERPSLLAVWPQGLCLDKGYDYPQIRQLAVELAIDRTFVAPTGTSEICAAVTHRSGAPSLLPKNRGPKKRLQLARRKA